jgi:hypothetical protein
MSQIIAQGLVLARQAANATDQAVLPQQSLDISSYPTSGLQQFGLFIIIFFPAVSLLLVGLRIYDRATTKTVGVDDFFIIGATVRRICRGSSSGRRHGKLIVFDVCRFWRWPRRFSRTL